MRRPLLLMTAAAAAAITLSACGSSSSSLPSALAGKPAKAIVNLSEAAMLAQGSLAASQSQTYQSMTATTSIKTSRTSAVETYGGFVGTGTVTMIGIKLYVQGDATFLANQFANATGTSNYAGKPIFVPVTDPNYLRIAQGLLLASFINSVHPVAPMKIVGKATFEGKSVLQIDGHVNPTTNQGATGKVSLYYSLTKPFLLVGAHVNVNVQGGGTTSGKANFGSYGEPVNAVAPSNAIVSTTTTLH